MNIERAGHLSILLKHSVWTLIFQRLRISVVGSKSRALLPCSRKRLLIHSSSSRFLHEKILKDAPRCISRVMSIFNLWVMVQWDTESRQRLWSSVYTGTEIWRRLCYRQDDMNWAFNLREFRSSGFRCCHVIGTSGSLGVNWLIWTD